MNFMDTASLESVVLNLFDQRHLGVLTLDLQVDQKVFTRAAVEEIRQLFRLNLDCT